MDIEKIKEDLSICYLKTIAAVRGIAVERIEHDEDSVDVVIKKVLNIDKNVSFNSQISVQLKATSSKSQYSIVWKTKQAFLHPPNQNNPVYRCLQYLFPSLQTLHTAHFPYKAPDIFFLFFCQQSLSLNIIYPYVIPFL